MKGLNMVSEAKSALFQYAFKNNNLIFTSAKLYSLQICATGYFHGSYRIFSHILFLIFLLFFHNSKYVTYTRILKPWCYVKLHTEAQRHLKPQAQSHSHAQMLWMQMIPWSHDITYTLKSKQRKSL